MGFEYFNTSSLAFGLKLTAAFTQLDNLKKSADRTIEDILELQDIFNEVIGKNYQVPAPVTPTSACRTNEIFDVIRGEVHIKQLEVVNGKLKVFIVKLDKYTNKVTVASGETELKKGYAFVTLASSNKAMNKTIRFSKDSKKEGTEVLMFKFMVDNDNKVTLLGNCDFLNVFPQDYTQYKSISKGEGIKLPYTAKDYCCICVVGNVNWIDVTKNGRIIVRGGGNACQRHAIVYLKPDDVVKGTASKAFKVKYNY